MSSPICIEPHYLGGTDFFQLLARHDTIEFESQDHYRKQTFRNRCRILTANGVQDLVVPVHFGNRTKTCDVKIDYNQRWVKDHKGAIRSAYSKAPFFEHYYPRFEELLNKQPTYLLELSLDAMTLCLDLLKLEVNVSQTTIWQKELDSAFFDARDKISPKIDLSDGIFYKANPYLQNFGNNFVERLSVLDALMCLGNETPSVILRGS